jgi:hypothetical protein
MSKSTGGAIREIIIVLAIVGLILLLYTFLKKPKPDLSHDINLSSPPTRQQTQGRMMGHGVKFFPEDDETVVAVAFGHEITLAELHQEANRLFRRYGVEPDSEMAQVDAFQDRLKAEGLGEILSGLLIYERASEFGIDAKAVIDAAMDEWSEGYDSPEEKLASIPDNPDITVERMCKMFIKQNLTPLIEKALTEDMEGITHGERVGVFVRWLVEGLEGVEINFRDENLKRSWNDYLNQLKDNNIGHEEFVQPSDEGE